MDYRVVNSGYYYECLTGRRFRITLWLTTGLLEVELPAVLATLRIDNGFLALLADKVTRKVRRRFGKGRLKREKHFGHLRFIVALGPLERLQAIEEIAHLLDLVKFPQAPAQ